ncbi:hypothetical protein RY27_11865 [Litorilinea aerophila]|nr:hypothetical protein RY27_11865 [Litorilinea aerophila]
MQKKQKYRLSKIVVTHWFQLIKANRLVALALLVSIHLSGGSQLLPVLGEALLSTILCYANACMMRIRIIGYQES